MYIYACFPLIFSIVSTSDPLTMNNRTLVLLFPIIFPSFTLSVLLVSVEIYSSENCSGRILYDRLVATNRRDEQITVQWLQSWKTCTLARSANNTTHTISSQFNDEWVTSVCIGSETEYTLLHYDWHHCQSLIASTMRSLHLIVSLYVCI